ncbi:MAG TPA: EamA family transporter, partial [Anaerolineae bacterium]|nr:EamA family transporter [Anaerolineae bacterium]
LEILGAVIYQGVVVAGLCFIFWTSLLQNHSASRLVVFSFITPVFGVWLSALVLGETISPVLVGGLLLVTAGIIVVNRRSSG